MPQASALINYEPKVAILDPEPNMVSGVTGMKSRRASITMGLPGNVLLSGSPSERTVNIILPSGNPFKHTVPQAWMTR